MEKHPFSAIKGSTAAIALLLLALILSCVHCAAVVRDNRFDERIVGTYECTLSSPDDLNWQFLSFFSDGSFGIYGPRYDFTKEVEGGTYILQEADESGLAAIALTGGDGATLNGVHYRDLVFVENGGTLYCFRKTAPVPASWSAGE